MFPFSHKIFMESDRDSLICFSDGSCFNNGRKNARAGFACVFPNHPDHTFSAPVIGPLVTNNRAEYTALLRAMEISDTIDQSRTKTLHFYTDSMLLVNTATKWMAAWKRNGWRKADGDPVMNLDLVQEISAKVDERPVVFHHVRAHTGKKDWESRWNEVADKLAKEAVAN